MKLYKLIEDILVYLWFEYFSLFVYREVRRKCAAAMIVSHARDMETAVQSMLQGAYLGLGL